MLSDTRQLLGDARWRQYKIDAPVRDGAVWHAGESRRARLLDECDASLLLDLCQAQRSVGTSSRENNPDGTAAVLLSKRSKEMIDRHVQPASVAARRKPKCHAVHGHVGVGWGNVDMVRLDGHMFPHLLDRHLGHSGQ